MRFCSIFREAQHTEDTFLLLSVLLLTLVNTDIIIVTPQDLCQMHKNHKSYFCFNLYCSL